MRDLYKNISGDTIIEVLICVVVLGVILTGAYVTSNNSLRSIREAQDRIQALGVAQAQVEDLRALASTELSTSSPYITPSPGAPFCFYTSGGNTIIGTGNNCVSTAFPIQYTTSIVATSGPAMGTPTYGTSNPPYNFTITVKWLSPRTGQKYDYVYLYYRVSV